MNAVTPEHAVAKPMTCKRSALSVAIFQTSLAHGHLLRALNEWVDETGEATVDKETRDALRFLIRSMGDDLSEFMDWIETFDDDGYG